MKPLLLYVTSDLSRTQMRAERLGQLYNITVSSPEQAVVHVLQARYNLIVVCSSVRKRKLQPFLDFTGKAAHNIPVLLLRTGRERHSIRADVVMRDDDEAELMRSIEKALIRWYAQSA